MTNRALVLLSGEETSVPAAEARSLFLTYDETARFTAVHPRVILAESDVDPTLIASRIAFARRVGVLVSPGEAAEMLRGRRIRFRAFDLRRSPEQADPERYLADIDAQIDLESPEFELTLVRADEDYLAVTSPSGMVQGWSLRRPRKRPYFHPAAIFPKLSRALVNMSRCKRGDVFTDPFAGTGSLPMEASLIGARVVAIDQADAMSRGEMANMKHFHQEWLGAVRADSTAIPLTGVDAVATDVPYGRAASTRGSTSKELVESFIPAAAQAMRRGSVMVIMHQKEVGVEGGLVFDLLEEHDLHVHKRLTRTISILRRR